MSIPVSTSGGYSVSLAGADHGGANAGNIHLATTGCV